MPLVSIIVAPPIEPRFCMLNLDMPATVVLTRIEPYQVDFALQISENLLLEFVATKCGCVSQSGMILG